MSVNTHRNTLDIIGAVISTLLKTFQSPPALQLRPVLFIKLGVMFNVLCANVSYCQFDMWFKVNSHIQTVYIMVYLAQPKATVSL